MQPTQKPRVKICCISSIQEARLAIQYGASALGLVSAMPSGPGVITEELITQIAATIPPGVASFLHSGNQSLAVKELGGTGRTHNWEISRKIREAVDVPIFLAGGLNADNIVEAITQVGPFGVDLCSSVRTNGGLDEEKLARFFSKVYTLTSQELYG